MNMISEVLLEDNPVISKLTN